MTVKIDEDLVRSARRLASRANRYHRLAQLGAPDMILEFERELIFKALVDLPALPNTIAMRVESHNLMREEEEKFLKEHGFYNDEALEKLNKLSDDMGEEL